MHTKKNKKYELFRQRFIFNLQPIQNCEKWQNDPTLIISSLHPKDVGGIFLFDWGHQIYTAPKYHDYFFHVFGGTHKTHKTTWD